MSPLQVFAECCVFVKQSHGPVHCASRHCPGGPLLPKLRGYFAEFLNEVSLARLGICVGFGTAGGLIRMDFSGKHGRMALRAASRTLGPAVPGRARGNHLPTPLSFSDPSLNPRQCRNVDLPSIDYAFRPRLRCRLTPGGRTCPGKPCCPGKPWDSGDGDFHPIFRYSCPHNR